MENNRTNFDLKLGQFGPNEADAEAEAKKMAEASVDSWTSEASI